jgi:uncharacterized protein (TIGR02001 family)
VAAALLAGPALADGMPTRGKVAQPQPEPRACTLSANVGLATEYVFRGFSQTAEGPAIQGGFDATCRSFYIGAWASNLDFAGGQGATLDVLGFPFDASIEIDWYTGFKPKTGPITWDIGFIYYSYPNASTPGLNLDYYEFKLGASGEIWKDGTLGVTAFYSPDYQLESGVTWTFEAAFVQAFSKFWMLTPSVSALLGYQTNEGTDSYHFSFSPRPMVERASPVICETASRPPRPAARTSLAANIRRLHSSSFEPTAFQRLRIACVSTMPTRIMPQRRARNPATPSHITAWRQGANRFTCCGGCPYAELGIRRIQPSCPLCRAASAIHSVCGASFADCSA